MEKLFWTVAMFLLLLPTGIDAGECGNVEEGFCKADKCVATFTEEYRECDLNYPHIYKGRINDFPFSVNEDDGRLKSYKFGLMTFTTEWHVVEPCCNLKLNETCKLRPLKSEEYLYLFGVDEEENYCWKYIIEEPASELKWCSKTKVKRPCLDFENGEIIERRNFCNSNFAKVKHSADCCFFEIPNDVVVTGTLTDEGLIRDVSGIQLLGDKVLTESKNTTCNVTKGVTNLKKCLSSNEPKPGHAVCVFFRMKDSPWMSLPCCMKREYPSKNPDGGLGLVWIVVLGVLAGIVFLLFLSLAVRFQIKKCVPSYDETKGGIPKSIIQIEESQKFLDDHEKELHTKELPDEIVFQGSKNSTGIGAESSSNTSENYVLDTTVANNNTEESKFKQSPPNSDEHVRDITAADVFPYLSKQDFCCEVNHGSEFAPKGQQFQPYVCEIAMETANKKTMASPKVSGYTDKDEPVVSFGNKNQKINFDPDNRDSASTCDTFCELNSDDSIEDLPTPICTCSGNNVIPVYVKRVTVPGNESSLNHSSVHSKSYAKCKVHSFESGDYVDKVFA